MKSPSRKSHRRESETGKEVFVSVGHGLTRDEEAFLQEVRDFLARIGVRTVTIERQAQMVSDPIGTIRAAIQRTSGTVVIAIERFRTGDVVEFPKSEQAIGLGPLRLATVWNQIEAGMALQAGRPLLLLVEEGLAFQGVVDPAIHEVIHFAPRAAGERLPQSVCDALERWSRLL